MRQTTNKLDGAKRRVANGARHKHKRAKINDRLVYLMAHRQAVGFVSGSFKLEALAWASVCCVLEDDSFRDVLMLIG